MQNKANFGKAQMNVSSSITMNYEQKTMNYTNKNKANTKPIKANSNPIKANTKPIQSQYKANLSRRSLCCKSAEAGRSRTKPNFKRGTYSTQTDRS
jgi:hypothetical protein